jgi:hypothetical protein
MNPPPSVSRLDLITIRMHCKATSKRAVVCSVPDSEAVEVVYLDERNRAINEDVHWVEDRWEFVGAGPCGGYMRTRSAGLLIAFEF